MFHERYSPARECFGCEIGPYFFSTLTEELFFILNDEGEFGVLGAQLNGETTCSCIGVISDVYFVEVLYMRVWNI
jgi:hypothetical protein